MLVAKAHSGAAGLRSNREGNMRLLTIAAVLNGLAGCASQPQEPPPITDGQRLRCQAEARRGALAAQVGFATPLARTRMEDDCYAAATAENIEALQGLLGFRMGGDAPPATPTQGAIVGGFAEACGETALTPRLRARLERSLTPAALAAAWNEGRAAMRGPNVMGACAAVRGVFRYGARQMQASR